jgi:NADH-quinone oxidoreductase subunit H
VLSATNMAEDFTSVCFLLLSVSYFTLLERKVMGTVQRRRGPSVVGAVGVLQPLVDGLKLFVREPAEIGPSARLPFSSSPLLLFLFCLVVWGPVPFGLGQGILQFNLGVLYFLAVSALSVYSILLSGWSSNSKYALLGSLRTVAQMISYEISFGFLIMIPVIFCQSLSFVEIANLQRNIWFFIPLFPVFLAFFISSLAETSRHPFDLPEAESELVSGYNVEYSGMLFAFFFLSEYGNLIFLCSVMVDLFFGGSSIPLCFYVDAGDFFTAYAVANAKTLVLLLLACWARVALPRYRYDGLMELGWKMFCPLSISWIFLCIWYMLSFNII